MSREENARINDVTPEYITMLSKQPLFLEYLQEMALAVDAQLKALYGQGVQVLAEVMKSGKDENRLRAAQMVMRANGKEGSVNVNGTVHHKHSLVGILQTLPPAGSVVERDVTIWNAPETAGNELLGK